jgi:superfamily I DNA/RNA helicase
MVDEFQDTNANQMMISLMILSEPNLCVVGDWKQGIYGFRFVTIENIIDFERKAVEMRRFLNDDYTRIRYRIPEISKLPLDVNFRSSQQIIDKAFECICMPATSDEAKNNKPD